MIRITIEMCPKGDTTKARVMAQGVMVNDGTGNKFEGNYIYGFSGQAEYDGQDPGIETSGRLTGFPRRKENVWELLKRCLVQGDQGYITADGKRVGE